jgi:hypothetical protein
MFDRPPQDVQLLPESQVLSGQRRAVEEETPKEREKHTKDAHP